MSGYHQPPSGYNTYGAQSYNYGAPPPQQQYNYGAPPPPYGAPPQTSSPYGAPSAPHGEKPQKPKYDMGGGGGGGGYGSNPPSAAPYGSSPPSAPYGGSPSSAPYGGSPAPYGGTQPSAPYGSTQPSAPYGSSYPPPAQYGSPFASLVPSAFPPGTDPNIVACFQMADQDGSGFIDDKELQSVLSSYNERFSIRTVHLLMFHFTNTNVKKIGPKEFIAVFHSLQSWRSIFERFDRDRSGKIDSMELQNALLSLGFSVSPVILDLLVSKFDKTGGRNKAIEYDNFIECCLTVKGLTEKFKERDTNYSGSATFTYESFMLTVLPFLIA